MGKRFQEIISKVIRENDSPLRLSLSCCVGIFVACSPFLGIQTIVATLLSMLFRLNTPLVIIVLFLVNNPFTMVPIILLNYFTGYFLFKVLFNYNITLATPAYFAKIDTYVSNTLHKVVPSLQFSLAYYIIGGLIFAALCSSAAYPFIHAGFKRMRRQ